MKRASRQSITSLALAALMTAGGAALVTARVPQSGEAPSVRFELPNGLRVWVQEDHRRPVVRVEVLYKVGWINEGPGTTGIAHYVEHMVFRAGENIRNEDIFGFIDRIGGRWTGGTAQLGTSYAETVPSWGLEGVLRIEAERMSRALFDPTEFERERSAVITEANGYVATDPAEILGDELLAASFELHPYRYGSGTWARDNLVATRDDAHDFYQRYYGPDNAVLAVVGDVSVDAARRLVDRHFGPLRPAGRSGEVLLVEPPQRVEKRLTVTAPGAQQRLEIAYRAPGAADPDYPVLVVLDSLLTVGGRLQRAVAPAGGTDVAGSFRATPYPYIYRISVTAAASADLEHLLAAVQGEIDRVGRAGAPQEEIEAAREAARRGRGGGRGGGRRGGGRGGARSSLPSSDPRESITQVATRLTEAEVFPWEVSPGTLAEIRRAQEEVTVADLEAYVDRWLRPSQRTAGFLVSGDSDFVPQWTDGRPIVGERLEIPALTVPPAKRMRPDPLPAAALQPLPDVGIANARRRLDNGIVLRAARRDGPALPSGSRVSAPVPRQTAATPPTAALQARIRVGADPPGKEGLSLLVARLIATDPGLQAVIENAGGELSDTAHTAPVEAANAGTVDLRLRFRATDTAAMVQALALALRTELLSPQRIDLERARLLEEVEAEQAALAAAPGAGGRDRGRQALSVAARARDLALAASAPDWHVTIPATAAALRGITVEEVNGRLSGVQAGNGLTVSLVGPGDPVALLDALQAAFIDHPDGPAPADVPVHPVRGGTSGSQPATQRISRAGEFQVTVAAALPGVPADHPDAGALELLNYIVGMPYYGGRLGWALTKGGLTYSSAATTTFGASTGHVLLSTECDTANLEATLQAIGEIVAGIADAGVQEWELSEAQASTLGRMVLYGPGPDSDEETLAAALLDSESMGVEVLDYPARSRAVLAVTHAQLNAVARRYYRPELLHVVAIGALPAVPAPSPFPAGTFRDLFGR